MEGGRLIWTAGGGDSFDGNLDDALNLMGVTDTDLRSAIWAAYRAAPEGHQTYELQEGDEVGAMVSGKGKDRWVARDAVVQPGPEWKKGADGKPEMTARVWYVVVNGHQYRLMLPEVCGNWALKAIFGPPLRCRCEPGKDAC